MEEGTKTYSHCNACGGMRNATVLKSHKVTFQKTPIAYSIFIYCVVQCDGCDYVYFLECRHYSDQQIPIGQDPESGETIFTEDSELITWPPRNERIRPKWLSELIVTKRLLGQLFEDVYGALDQNSFGLACIGIRTIIDMIAVDQGSDEALPFADKLAFLQDIGKVSKDEKLLLLTTIDAGSAAAHRNWKPNSEELSRLFDLVENFVQRIYFIGVGFEQIRTRIPKKPKRKS